MKTCNICENSDGKYKCPTCLIYYCSVACCRKHRATQCELSKPTPETAVTTENDKKKGKYEFVTADTVPQERLELLGQSEEIKKLLSNPHLRNLLKSIDTCHNPEEIMQKAMLEPIFIDFADACLKIVEPPGNEAT